MKFSIIVPVYNVENYIEQALNSILSQTYKDYEVIVVNDGSTDQSLKICESYKEKFQNITIITQKNGGLSEARNTGIKIAQGEFIYFFDSDDYMNPVLLETVNKQIEKDEELDMVQFHYESFKNNVVKQDSFKFSTIPNDKVLNNSELVNYLYNGKKTIFTAWSYVIRTSIIQNNNLEFIPRIIDEDVLFIYSCFKFVRHYVCLSDILYYYRLRKGSITQTFDRTARVYSVLVIIAYLYDMYYHSDEDSIYAKWLWNKLQHELDNYLLESFSLKEAIYVYKRYGGKDDISTIKIVWNRIKYLGHLHFINLIKRLLRLFNLY